MNKKSMRDKFFKIIMLVVSLIIVVILCMFLLDTTGMINQGGFRVNDLVVFSTVSVKDTNDQVKPAENTTTDTTNQTAQNSVTNLSDLKLDVSQNNSITFLIAKTSNIEATSIYIDNVKISYPKLTENMYIYQDEKNKIDLKTEKIKLDLNKEDKDGQYQIKLNVDNINCIKQVTIPQNSTSIVYDGTIFNVLNTKISDVAFNISFNLNIVDSTGKTNICKVNLNLPNELLASNGLSIIKEDSGQFPFRIK